MINIIIIMISFISLILSLISLIRDHIDDLIIKKTSQQLEKDIKTLRAIKDYNDLIGF